MKANRTKIVVALGSNVNQEAHIEQAKSMLEATFSDMFFGTSLWTEPIGMKSDNFLNVLGVGYTSVNKERTIQALKNIEHRCSKLWASPLRYMIILKISVALSMAN